MTSLATMAERTVGQLGTAVISMTRNARIDQAIRQHHPVQPSHVNAWTGCPPAKEDHRRTTADLFGILTGTTLEEEDEPEVDSSSSVGDDDASSSPEVNRKSGGDRSSSLAVAAAGSSRRKPTSAASARAARMKKCKSLVCRQYTGDLSTLKQRHVATDFVGRPPSTDLVGRPPAMDLLGANNKRNTRPSPKIDRHTKVRGADTETSTAVPTISSRVSERTSTPPTSTNDEAMLVYFSKSLTNINADNLDQPPQSPSILPSPVEPCLELFAIPRIDVILTTQQDDVIGSGMVRSGSTEILPLSVDHLCPVAGDTVTSTSMISGSTAQLTGERRDVWNAQSTVKYATWPCVGGAKVGSVLTDFGGPRGHRVKERRHKKSRRVKKIEHRSTDAGTAAAATRADREFKTAAGLYLTASNVRSSAGSLPEAEPPTVNPTDVNGGQVSAQAAMEIVASESSGSQAPLVNKPADGKELEHASAAAASPLPAMSSLTFWRLITTRFGGRSEKLTASERKRRKQQKKNENRARKALRTITIILGKH